MLCFHVSIRYVIVGSFVSIEMLRQFLIFSLTEEGIEIRVVRTKIKLEIGQEITMTGEINLKRKNAVNETEGIKVVTMATVMIVHQEFMTALRMMNMTQAGL